MVATATARPQVRRSFKKSEIPTALVHEIMDGKPLYRRGYREVMNKTKQIEEIMGTGTLQFRILGYLAKLLHLNLNEDDFIVAHGEPGLHLDRRNNLSNDIAIFSTSVLTAELTTKKYPEVPPVVSIEIDTDVEFEDMGSSTYINIKTQKLLDFGVEKVVWFFTASKKVLVARRGEDWTISDWTKDVELMPGIVANVARFLEEKGIQV